MTFECLLPKGACQHCGKQLTGKRTRWCSQRCATWFVNNHRWTQARRTARRLAKYKCSLCESTVLLEVNHIVPCLGQHSAMGCHHHQTNLQVLCRPCHLTVTRQQRADGLFKKAA